jgi:hypothetical protein
MKGFAGFHGLVSYEIRVFKIFRKNPLFAFSSEDALFFAPLPFVPHFAG